MLEIQNADSYFVALHGSNKCSFPRSLTGYYCPLWKHINILKSALEDTKTKPRQTYWPNIVSVLRTLKMRAQWEITRYVSLPHIHRAGYPAWGILRTPSLNLGEYWDIILKHVITNSRTHFETVQHTHILCTRVNSFYWHQIHVFSLQN